MKKGCLLNGELSALIAKMGHTETLAVADCGLPIRGNAERVDLALRRGIPGFLETVDTMLTELAVERVILAEELKTQSPAFHDAVLERFPGIPVDYVPHESFKTLTETCRAVIRTGECTPYANVILVSGVFF